MELREVAGGARAKNTAGVACAGDRGEIPRLRRPTPSHERRREENASVRLARNDSFAVIGVGDCQDQQVKNCGCESARSLRTLTGFAFGFFFCGEETVGVVAHDAVDADGHEEAHVGGVVYGPADDL